MPEIIANNLVLVMILSALWTLPWKGVALWKAARNGDRGWFIIILIVNTLAILEILYIVFFSKREASPTKDFE